MLQIGDRTRLLTILASLENHARVSLDNAIVGEKGGCRVERRDLGLARQQGNIVGNAVQSPISQNGGVPLFPSACLDLGIQLDGKRIQRAGHLDLGCVEIGSWSGGYARRRRCRRWR